MDIAFLSRSRESANLMYRAPSEILSRSLSKECEGISYYIASTRRFLVFGTQCLEDREL